MAQLQCEIVTPESKLFSDTCGMVVLPAANGQMGIMPKHEPVTTTLSQGLVRVKEDTKQAKQSFVVSGGYAQIDGSSVIVLANRAAALDELDGQACRARISELKEQLSSLEDDAPTRPYLADELSWNELLLDKLA